tara:strand:- start:322 stop:585 length:264 start_codon:yes stop_codon:yes gene_type:complete
MGSKTHPFVVSSQLQSKRIFCCGGLAARKWFGILWILASTVAKLKPSQQVLMPRSLMTNVEMTCLQGLTELERLEGPWLDDLATGDP